MKIHQKILVGMGLGILTGHLFGAHSPFEFFQGELGQRLMLNLNIVGEIFLKLLKMVVVPLIFFSMVLGIASMDSVASIGKAGSRILLYFLGTTALAITIGLSLSLMIEPGSYLHETKRLELMAENNEAIKKMESLSKSSQSGMVELIRKNLLDMIPANPIESMAKTQILQIIVFALFFGIGITGLEEKKKKTLLETCQGINDIMVYLVEKIVLLAPYGVFTLMAEAISKQGLGILNALAAYFVTVILGLMLQLVFYLTVVRLAGGLSPLYFLRQMREALILAFSTSSSSATLPVTMRLAEKGLGIPPKTTSFVLPLGATINMDGTALYQGVAVVFICQVYGHALGPIELLTIVLMATMASIGAAGIPGAGILTLVMVLDSVAPVLVAGIALILGVDRILDMCRTTVNVCGDCAACIVMNLFNTESSEPKP